MSKLKLSLQLLALATAAGCASFPDADMTVAVGEQMVASAYPGMPPTLSHRAVQDPEQQLCSKPVSQKLTSEEAAQIVQSAKESIKYPGSGQLTGDWKIGQRLVINGVGMRVRDGRVEPAKENGALCVNCHALDPKTSTSAIWGRL